jgi:hypothetical protein
MGYMAIGVEDPKYSRGVVDTSVVLVPLWQPSTSLKKVRKYVPLASSCLKLFSFLHLFFYFSLACFFFYSPFRFNFYLSGRGRLQWRSDDSK